MPTHLFSTSTTLALATAFGTLAGALSAHAQAPKPQMTSSPTVDPLASMKIDHVMVHAADFETSDRWYRETLGFEPVVEWTVDGLDGTRLSYLERNGFLIELVSAPTGDQTAALPTPADFAEHFAQRGFTHLCFLVDDVDATLTELAQRGTPTFSGPIDFPALGVRVGFIQDPDGNVIEFKGPMAGNNVLAGKADWKQPKDPPMSDEAKVRAILDQWIEGWSPGDAAWRSEPMRPLYAAGDDAVTVFDNVAGGVIELDNFDQYAAQWEPMMASMRGFRIVLERPAEVSLDGDLAVASFVFSGGEDQAYEDAFRIRQFGTIVMRRTGDGWKIIHEHLTSDANPEPMP
ncbi:MAG: VOC family protein [Planctomycetota bacterium]